MYEAVLSRFQTIVESIVNPIVSRWLNQLGFGIHFVLFVSFFTFSESSSGSKGSESPALNFSLINTDGYVNILNFNRIKFLNRPIDTQKEFRAHVNMPPFSLDKETLAIVICVVSCARYKQIYLTESKYS